MLVCKWVKVTVTAVRVWGEGFALAGQKGQNELLYRTGKPILRRHTSAETWMALKKKKEKRKKAMRRSRKWIFQAEDTGPEADASLMYSKVRRSIVGETSQRSPKRVTWSSLGFEKTA